MKHVADALQDRIAALPSNAPGKHVDWTCERCHKTARVPMSSWGTSGICQECREKERIEGMATDEWWSSALRCASVPPAYHIPQSTTYSAEAAEFIASGGTLTYQGALGTGKTWEATRVFGERIRTRGEPKAQWIDTSHALQLAKAEWKSEYQGETVRLLVEVPLLLLDDVGAEPSYEFAQADLSYILRQRYNWQRDTIVTCQSLDDLEGRLASRLAGGIVVRKTGGDRRLG